jgi:tetraacyldisaccharide 4'-kinase
MRPPEFWTKKDAASRLASIALSPVGWAYGASVAWKRDHAQSHRSRAKVVCIGNLTVGGSGKTPVAISVANYFLEKGIRAVLLTRGYGGHLEGPELVEPAKHTARDVGDEALLLAASAPTIVAADRKSGAMLADALRTQVIVMDDGHQNFGLAKDVSVVVVDTETGFGNGAVLPAGPLREPVEQGMARADAVAVVGDGDVDLHGFGGPLLRVRLASASEDLKGRRVVAFAGIGRPAKFFTTLKAVGADVLKTHEFADHHLFTSDEIRELKNSALRYDAALITTEKDFVRLNIAQREGIERLPIRAVFDTSDALDRLLNPVVQSMRAAS